MAKTSRVTKTKNALDHPFLLTNGKQSATSNIQLSFPIITRVDIRIHPKYQIMSNNKNYKKKTISNTLLLILQQCFAEKQAKGRYRNQVLEFEKFAMHFDWRLEN